MPISLWTLRWKLNQEHTCELNVLLYISRTLEPQMNHVTEYNKKTQAFPRHATPITCIFYPKPMTPLLPPTRRRKRAPGYIQPRLSQVHALLIYADELSLHAGPFPPNWLRVERYRATCSALSKGIARGERSTRYSSRRPRSLSLSRSRHFLSRARARLFLAIYIYFHNFLLADNSSPASGRETEIEPLERCCCSARRNGCSALYRAAPRRSFRGRRFSGRAYKGAIGLTFSFKSLKRMLRWCGSRGMESENFTLWMIDWKLSAWFSWRISVVMGVKAEKNLIFHCCTSDVKIVWI